VILIQFKSEIRRFLPPSIAPLATIPWRITKVGLRLARWAGRLGGRMWAAMGTAPWEWRGHQETERTIRGTKLMKIALLVLVLLGAGVFGLIMLSSSGGSTQSSQSFARLLSGEGVEKSGKPKRVSLTCQITEMLNKFDPIEFMAIDVGTTENETQEQSKARIKNNPRIRVVYHGHDKFVLTEFNQVHVTGTFNAATNTFNAEQISTQCPSRYEGETPVAKEAEVNR